MQTLDPECAAAWVGRWLNVEAVFGDSAGAVSQRRFLVPEREAPVHAVCSQWVAWLIVDRASVLVWVYEFGVWPSSEDWNLYYRWRRDAGDAGVIEQTPGHLFMAHEAVDAVSLIMMARAFGWGFRGVSRDWGRALQIDHDGHGTVAAMDASIPSIPAAWLGSH